MTLQRRPAVRRLLPLLTLLSLSAPASAAALWAGVDASSGGAAFHAGAALLPLPFVGGLGVEGGVERGWNGQATRFSVGVALVGLRVPLTRLDAFAGVGAEFADAARSYAEAGLRGPLLGPAVWRLHLRKRGDGAFSGRLGLEVRF